MKTKNIFILCMLLLCNISIFSNVENVVEYNQRALSSIKNDPSNSIYYGNKSIQENIEYEFVDEYIKSLFIISKAYNVLEDDYLQLDYFNTAYKYLNSKSLFYSDNNFYTDYARLLFRLNEYEKFEVLIINEDIISTFNNESIIIFNILKIKNDIRVKNEIDYVKLDQMVELSKNLNSENLLSEIYLLLGDVYMEKDKNKSVFYYKKSSELSKSNYSIISLINLGLLTNNLDYYKEAYLNSQNFNEYYITTFVLKNVLNEYKRRNDFNNSLNTLEDMLLLETNHKDFLILQNKKIEKFGFERELLALKLEQTNNSLSMFYLLLIAMGVIIIFMIVILSIQSYRLRSINI